MSYVMPPQPTPKQQKYRKRLIRRLKKRGMFIKDAKHKGAGTYGLLAPHGKMYIGKSGRYKGRMQDHKKTAYNKKKDAWKENRYLYRAIRKWGWDRFEKFLFQKHDIRRGDIDDVLNKQEVALIAEFETFTDQSKGYNLTAGGEGTSGYKHTPEQVAAHTARMKKQWDDPEYKEKMRAVNKEAQNRPEVKAANSERSKKMWADPEFKAKMSVTMKEVANRPEVKAARNRPEAKAAHSERSKKMWGDPEYRTKTSAAIKQAHNTQEVKAAHSAASKRNWEDPEYRAKVSAATTEAQNRPEVKAAHSAAAKKMWASEKGTKMKEAQIKRQSKPVVSKQLVSGKNTIKEYQLRYHAGRTIGAEDLRLLFGMNFSRTSISQVITGRKKRHLGFFFENYTGAPGQPTPENPKKKIKDTYY